MVEPDRTLLLRIRNSTLYPTTTIISTPVTVIHIINNDREFVCTSFFILYQDTFLFLLCVGLQVSIEASSSTIYEGEAITLSVGYSGLLQNLTTISVLVHTSPGSATCQYIRS